MTQTYTLTHNGDKYRVTFGPLKTTVVVYRRGKGTWRNHMFWAVANKRDGNAVIAKVREEIEFLEAYRASRPSYPRMQDIGSYSAIEF